MMMKLCIPVVSPDGLSSQIAPDPAGARFLHFFDTELQSYEEVDLATTEVLTRSFDAVICTRISRHVFRALRERDVEVFLCEAETVSEAIEEFRSGTLSRIPDEAAGCGGGCHGHEAGEAHGGESCGCHSDSKAGGCGGGCHSHAGSDEGAGCAGGHRHGEGSHTGHDGCGCGAGSAIACKPRVQRGADAPMKIAVTSQNRKTVTEHAGKCRKFWIYETQGGNVVSKSLLELSQEESLHEWNSSAPHPLVGMDLLITASAGDGMKKRLADWGIEVFVTEETDPDTVVASFLAVENA